MLDRWCGWFGWFGRFAAIEVVLQDRCEGGTGQRADLQGPLAGGLQARLAMAFCQAENADAGSEALFRVGPVGQDEFDEDLGIGSVGGGIAANAFEAPAGVPAVGGRHVLVHGRVAPVGGATHVGRHPPFFMKDLDGAIRDAGPELLPGQGMGHGIVMPGDLNMVIEAGPALLPLGVFASLGGQRLQGRAFQLLEQPPAAGAQVFALPIVQFLEQFTDGLVGLGQGEEAAVAQAGQDAALDPPGRQPPPWPCRGACVAVPARLPCRNGPPSRHRFD